MKKMSIVPLVSAAAAVLSWGAAFPVTAQHQHGQPADMGVRTAPAEQTLTVGKRDDVSFSADVRIGDVTVSAGAYRIQHRVDGSEHFIRFAPVAASYRSDLPPGEARDVRCRLEPMTKKAGRTAVYLRDEGDMRRVTRILVKGENVAHVF